MVKNGQIMKYSLNAVIQGQISNKWQILFVLYHSNLFEWNSVSNKKCLILTGNFHCNLCWSVPTLFCKDELLWQKYKIILTFFLSVCWFKCTGFRLHAFSKWFCAVTVDITQLPILVQRWEVLLWEAKWLHRQSSKLMHFHIPPFMLVKWN